MGTCWITVEMIRRSGYARGNVAHYCSKDVRNIHSALNIQSNFWCTWMVLLLYLCRITETWFIDPAAFCPWNLAPPPCRHASCLSVCLSADRCSTLSHLLFHFSLSHQVWHHDPNIHISNKMNNVTPLFKSVLEHFLIHSPFLWHNDNGSQKKHNMHTNMQIHTHPMEMVISLSLSVKLREFVTLHAQ